MATLRLALKDLAAELAKPIDYTPLMKKLGEILRNNASECFEQARTPDGGAWKALKRPRLNSKGGDIPLNDTGVLRSSIGRNELTGDNAAARNAKARGGEVTIEGPKSVEVGTNLDYAAIHQFGGTITPKQAKFLAIPATLEAQKRGSPRNWAPGELEFRFKGKGGVAFKKVGPHTNPKELIQYYFAKSVTIPARPYLGISDAQANDITGTIADYVAMAMDDKLTDAGAV